MRNEKKENTNLYYIDGQGMTKFSTRKGRIESTLDRESFWEKTAISVVIMLACLVLDFVAFKQLLGVLLHDRLVLQYFLTFGFLIPFDVAAVMLGILIKNRAQGLKAYKKLEWFLIAVIICAFLFSLWLRIVKKDELVPVSQSVAGSIFGTVSEEPTSDPAALAYAITTAFLPLGTTIVSIIASFICSNPLKLRLKKVRKQKVEMEAQINEMKCALTELEADRDLGERLDEQDLRHLTQKVLYARELGIFYADYVRKKIAEHVGQASSTNELSKNVHQAILEQNFPESVLDALYESEQKELSAIQGGE